VSYTTKESRSSPTFGTQQSRLRRVRNPKKATRHDSASILTSRRQRLTVASKAISNTRHRTSITAASSASRQATQTQIEQQEQNRQRSSAKGKREHDAGGCSTTRTILRPSLQQEATFINPQELISDGEAQTNDISSGGSARRIISKMERQ